jgi:EAL domain-containing protein (putative c-di-GMP-specific phosphodiesterase class I)
MSCTPSTARQRIRLLNVTAGRADVLSMGEGLDSDDRPAGAPHLAYPLLSDLAVRDARPDVAVVFVSVITFDPRLPLPEAQITRLLSRAAGPMADVTTFGAGEFVVTGGAGTAEAIAERIAHALHPLRADGTRDVTFLSTVTAGGRARRATAAARPDNNTAADLRRALTSEELVLHFQPSIDLATAEVVGLEVFVRWAHPVHGLLLPGQFLPVAERAGLMVPLHREVLRRACHQARFFQERHPGLSVTINLSSSQLRYGSVARDVLRAVRDAGVDPRTLSFDVKEADLAYAPAVEELVRVREQGMKVAVDDFGSGALTLADVLLLPVDTVKVDQRALVGTDATSVRRAIEGGRRHGLAAVAGGIERPEQLQAMRSAGFSAAQGFLIARPAAAPEMARMLADPS